MQTVLVRLFLHGLIAVAPVNGQGTATVPLSQGVNRMVALSVDGRQLSPDALPVEKRCFASHRPRLLVSAKASDCSHADCAPVVDHNVTLCECRAPFKKEIWLRPDVELPKLALAGKPKSELPALKAEASAFDNVPNLVNFGLELDPKFLAGSPAGLIGRMHFPVGSLTACSLADRDGPVSNVHAFGFQASNAGGGVVSSQVIPQQLEVQVPFAAGTHVSLHIADLDGSEPFDLPLTPIPDVHVCGNQPCIEIMLSDARPELLQGDPCDDGNGYDFAFFYELTKNPPAWRDRPIPHNQPDRREPSAPLTVSECNHGMEKGILGRPICAVAAIAKP
jgi:hypothetical protein